MSLNTSNNYSYKTDLIVSRGGNGQTELKRWYVKVIKLIIDSVIVIFNYGR